MLTNVTGTDLVYDIVEQLLTGSIDGRFDNRSSCFRRASGFKASGSREPSARQ